MGWTKERIGRGLALVAGCAALLLPAQAATINVTANITTSQTWTADNEYLLGTVIYVTSGATLTLEPGTVVRGLPDASTPGTNDPGTLVVTRGSKIRALGTALKPIVFTDQDDDNIGTDPGTFPYDDQDAARAITGAWGGLIVLGRGYVANNTLAGPSPSREIQIEGLTAAGGLGLYGNCIGNGLLAQQCDDDDSGALRYVSIRYGGFNLSANNEINGLTLGGVGRSTDIDHVEVFQNKDDGIELFGGAVNVKHMVVASAGDDSLDYDEGWRGKAQFVLALQGTPGTDKSDKGGEFDGGNNPDGSQPRAIPTIYNATLVGLGQKSFTDSAFNTALHLRDNAGGRVYNSAFLDFGGATVLIEGGSGGPTTSNTSGERAITAYTPSTGNCSVTTATSCDDNGDCPGGEVCVQHYQGASSAFQLELQDNDFWCVKRQELLAGPSFPVGGDRAPGVMVTQGVCSGSGAACLTATGCPVPQTCDDAPEDWGITLPGDANKIHHDNGMLSNAALDNDYYACASTLPIRELTRGVAAPDTPDPIVEIDPRPATGSSLLATNRSAPADGFFENAAYKGAFGTTNWAADWTALSRLGYFPPKPQINVTANITTSQTWTADNEYLLGTVIYVTSGATLTLEPGTVVRGLPDASTPGTNDPGTLVVTRGSKIQASGTASLPIVFTDLDDSKVGNSPGVFPYDSSDNARAITGAWGGLIVLGRGYVANNGLAGPSPSREVQIEGLSAAGGLGLYGNCIGNGLLAQQCDDDDSGTVRYVSIRYGGFNLSANNEINGLTLGAVGRGTDIDHVEVFQNKDDGIEFFGGAVNVKHMVVASAGDDSLDYDEGWRGKAQFVLALQGTPGTDKSDKGGEFDGGNNPDGSQPRAIPTIYNATLVGLGQKSFTDSAFNTALHLRDNAGGRVYNSAFLDFGGATVLIEGGSGGPTTSNTSGERAITAYTPSTGNCSVTTGTSCDDNGDCPGGEVCVQHYQGASSAFQLELQDNDFWCVKRDELLAGPSFPVGGDRAPGVMVTQGVCSGSGAACLTATGCPVPQTCDDAPEDWGITLPGDANKIHHDNGMLSNAALDNDYYACASTLPIRELARGVAAPDTPDPIVEIDPRPATGSSLLATNRSAPADGFFENAAYKGAFGTTNWAADWTNAGRLGYFATCATSGSATPDEVTNLRLSSDKATLVWAEPTLPGLMGTQLYDVLRKPGSSSAAAADFTGATCHETDDTDRVASDTALPASGSVFFYLVRAGNACGEGTLGFRSNGTERSGASCP